MLRLFALLASTSSASALLLPSLQSSPNLRPACAAACLPNSIIMADKRKPGVSNPDELQSFVAKAGAALLVVDVRNTNFELEPGDAKSNEKVRNQLLRCTSELHV